ncbi:Methyltransferase domain-containing protein [Maridesulfovibrio ferrireducens]|uniref:Methyltransferase domain-containing protein n=1 Tax=Maridesulfovibrio ferrireducens TaxID=246191 RepID=A0A1G9L8Z4_9BACT|nr:class I SAM-dependent methyltransferase [Maridesulfovibrio ferrireducens]SDL58286.1 Methyltransferase domain-containing protein [Maridesulfovibrio ferrireducens]
MTTENLRTIWDRKAEDHAAGRECRSQKRSSQLYHDSWWSYIQPLLSHIPNGRILEAGCGTGRWAEHLVPMGFDMVLSDFSPNMLVKAQDYAEKKGFIKGVSFEELDVCDLHTLKSESFDMVISTGEPISLCSDPQKAISEYCRVVRPGGYVLCDAGNRYRRAYDNFRASPSEQVLQILETGVCVMDNGMKLHLLGPGELTAIFEDQNMELCTLAGITPMLCFPPDPKLEKGMENDATYQAMITMGQKYAEHPEMIALSSRLIAVARKP